MSYENCKEVWESEAGGDKEMVEANLFLCSTLSTFAKKCIGTKYIKPLPKNLL
jgi:hypothetical protein